MTSTQSSTGHEHAHEAAHAHEVELAHVAQPKVLILTFAALIFLTALTIAVATVGFGDWDFLFAIAIASVKALLVCLFFMHLWYDKLFHALVFVAGVAFALLFIGFAYLDSQQYQKLIDWQDKKPLPEASHPGHDH